MKPFSRLAALVAAVLLGGVLIGTPAYANPGPGESNQCAPGQHDQNNQDPGWKPGSCDNH